MKITLFLLTSGLFWVIVFSCNPPKDPLANYAQFGKFKEIYPLRDTLSIDLKQGDSIAVETNLGKLIIKNNYTFNECSEQSKGYCDVGASSLLIFSLQQEKMYLLNAIESGVAFNPTQTVRLYPCNPQRVPNGPFEYSGLDRDTVFAGVNSPITNVFYSDVYYSIGSMTIQFRRIYPLSKDLEDSKRLSKLNLYHVVFTIQKTCR